MTKRPTPETTPPDPRTVLLRVPQVAKRLGISKTQTWRLVWSGEIKSITIGRLRLIPEVEIVSFISKRLAAG